ncbi:MAG: Ppx/GppA phosphatase family protein [Pirellulales bacterium]|nr:Ppx/GppA phosphatase family protein [Pirellulales bacterium]
MEEQQVFAELATRLAAIDIGSNSVRLIVAEPLRGGNYRILDEDREPTRLGRSLDSSGMLDEGAIEHSLAALRRFKQIAAGFQVAQLRCIATCAVREAANREDFVRRAQEELGLSIEVISGQQEGRLAFTSVQRAFDLTGKNVVVVDIGGGSTEFVMASGNAIEAIYSTPLGTVRLTEIHGSEPSTIPGGYEKLIADVEDLLKKHTRKPLFMPHLLIGTGGTFTTLAEMIMAQKGQIGLPVRGYLVTRAEVSHLLDRLRKIPLKQRRNLPGMTPDRADIMVTGLAIIDRIMARFKINMLQIHNRGLRDGLILTMLEEQQGAAEQHAAGREDALERFALACSGEPEHGRHVAQLAGMLFEQMIPRFALDVTDRPILEAAARLQDVGYLINYDQHHKHSYHLIMNSNLPGFRPRELQLIANVARYHRGAKPKPKHENFNQLEKADQEKVRQLAAILRVAGGLDRSRTQTVRGVRLLCEGKECQLLALAPELPEVDLWGARRRTEMFNEVFGVQLEIDWAGSEPRGFSNNGDGKSAEGSEKFEERIEL